MKKRNNPGCYCCDTGVCGECSDALPSTVTIDMGAAPIFGSAGNDCDDECLAIGGQYILDKNPPGDGCGYKYSQIFCTQDRGYYLDAIIWRFEIYVSLEFLFSTTWAWRVVFWIIAWGHENPNLSTPPGYSSSAGRAWYKYTPTTTVCTGKTHTIDFDFGFTDGNSPCITADSFPGPDRWPSTIDLIIP